MCCRFFLRAYDPELAPIVERAAASPLLPRFQATRPVELARSGEVFPGSLVPVVASDRRRSATVFPMLWGFSVPGRKALIVNARIETAAQKPSFREAWQSHRCVVPASWYYEWQRAPEGSARTKYAIRPKTESITYLCGLYRIENGLPVFVILTKEPCAELAAIHDRMPLILPKQAVRAWVDPASLPETLLARALSEMSAEAQD